MPSETAALNGTSAAGVTPADDNLLFRGSPRTTVGIEIELPVLDRDTGDLVPGAPRILDACREERVPGADVELMQSMVEVRTGVCADTGEVRNQIIERLRSVNNIARSLGYNLALMGTHPFLRLNASAVTDKERYQIIRMQLAWMTYYRVAFGLHVHVGVRDGDEAVGVINLVTPFLPHLLALSANSPFWQGVDTGLVSCRAPLHGLVPHSGVPGVFQKWKQFRNYYDVMRETGAFASLKDLKWDIRPRPDFGTIEFRICDMPMTLRAVFGLTALARTLVLWAQRLMRERPRSRRGDRRRQWITTQNKWLAARHGLDAIYLRIPGGKRLPLRDDLAGLLERLGPVAEPAGEAPFLKYWQPVAAIESGALRQRRIYRETGNWRALISDMTERLSKELAQPGTGTPTMDSHPPAEPRP